jgi:hypothetical protein
MEGGRPVVTCKVEVGKRVLYSECLECELYNETGGGCEAFCPLAEGAARPECFETDGPGRPVPPYDLEFHRKSNQRVVKRWLR